MIPHMRAHTHTHIYKILYLSSYLPDNDSGFKVIDRDENED